MSSYNPRQPGVHLLKIIEWSLYKPANKKNAGKPLVLAINALLNSLAALAATFRAVAFYCYLLVWCKATAKVNLMYHESDRS